MKAIIEHYRRNSDIYDAVGNSVGGVCLFGLVFAFCWLCCACSGYYWE